MIGKEQIINIKKKYQWFSIIDFLIANLIIVLVFSYIDAVLEFLSPTTKLYFVGIPKSYTPFIEGLMTGVLIGVYMFSKKKVNVLSITLGMWLYPSIKYTLYKPFRGIESWLYYLSALSMFIGIICVLVYLVSLSRRRVRSVPQGQAQCQ